MLIDIAADFEPELLQSLGRHLQKELREDYSPQTQNKGGKLSPRQFIKISFEADELQALLEEKGRQHQVRMVLPLFDSHAYSYTYCSCQELRVDLSDQRCHHMWAAQKALLDAIAKTFTRQEEEQSPQTKLAQFFRALMDEQQSLRAKETYDQRVYWCLKSDLSITAYLHERRANAKRRSSGEKLSWQNLVAKPELWLHPSDQLMAARLAQHFHNRSFSEGPLSSFALLYELRHHPHVFLLDLDTPLRIEEKPLVWTTEVDQDGLRSYVQLGPYPLQKCHFFSDEGLCYLEEDTRTLYLCPLSPVLADFLSQPSRPWGQLISHHHKQEFLEPLAQLQAIIPWQVKSRGLAQSQKPMPGFTYLRLTPLSPQGVVVEMLLRPFASASYPQTYLQPGVGSLRLWDLSAYDALYYVDRQLDEEREHALTLISQLGLDRHRQEAPYVWRLETDLDALAFLEGVASFQEKQTLILEWPDNLPKPYQWLEVGEEETLKVSVSKHRDWFSLEGELTIDGQKVDLLELLRALREHLSYLKLPHGKWLKISQQLRQRLESLNTLIAYDYGGEASARLSPAALGYWQEASKKAGLSVHAGDGAWQRLLERQEQLASSFCSPPESLQGELRSYQREGFRWLAERYCWGLGAILADDMGLGKTVQTLALLLQFANKGPSLILCPTSVLSNWLEEIRSFAPSLKPLVYRQERANLDLNRLGPQEVLLCTYGLLLHAQGELGSRVWNIVVFDEAQNIKNAQSKTAKLARAFQCQFPLALTGTPIENNLYELWSLFHTLNPELLGSWQNFKEHFLPEPEASSLIAEEKAARARRQLQSLISPFILRRLKSDYLKELPPKTEKILKVYLSPAERKLYDQLRLQAIAAMREASQSSEEEESNTQKLKIKMLAYLTKLRQITCHPALVEADWQEESAKTDLLRETCQRLLAGGHKALIFSQFASFLQLLLPKLASLNARCLHLDGSTAAKEREQRIRAFQKGEADFFLISLKAGGTGLNLTAADYVIHLDPWWNPAVEAQASDRAYRMGQQKPVTIYRFIAQVTVEEKIWAMHQEKKQLAFEVLQGTDKISPLNMAELEKLFTS